MTRRAHRARVRWADAHWHHRLGHPRLAFHGHRRMTHYAARSTISAAPPASGAPVETGRASYYAGGGRTAAGGSVGAATCAHRSLPFGTRVLVTNLANLRQTVLTVNDRGPFVRGRLLDVSRSAAGVLGMIGSGIARIRMEVMSRPG